MFDRLPLPVSPVLAAYFHVSGMEPKDFCSLCFEHCRQDVDVIDNLSMLVSGKLMRKEKAIDTSQSSLIIVFLECEKGKAQWQNVLR